MTAPDGVTCRTIVELATEYLEGTMSLDRRARFEEHLQMCEGCANYLDQMRETIRIMGTLSEESLPSEVQAELLRAFRDWKRA